MYGIQLDVFSRHCTIIRAIKYSFRLWVRTGATPFRRGSALNSDGNCSDKEDAGKNIDVHCDTHALDTILLTAIPGRPLEDFEKAAILWFQLKLLLIIYV